MLPCKTIRGAPYRGQAKNLGNISSLRVLTFVDFMVFLLLFLKRLYIFLPKRTFMPCWTNLSWRHFLNCSVRAGALLMSSGREWMRVTFLPFRSVMISQLNSIPAGPPPMMTMLFAAFIYNRNKQSSTKTWKLNVFLFLFCLFACLFLRIDESLWTNKERVWGKSAVLYCKCISICNYCSWFLHRLPKVEDSFKT